MTISSSMETVKVVAPATLSEGYTFDAVVDGRTVTVTVPTGGVKEGETFEAIVPSVAGGIVATTTKTIVNNPDGTRTVTEETTYPDGRVVKAVSTVPVGGGDAEDGLATPLLAQQQPPPAATVGVEGRWRHDLFACCDLCCNGMFWMAACCNYAAVGQLLQRLRMNVIGQRTAEYKSTCMIWTIICVIVLAFDFGGGYSTPTRTIVTTDGNFDFSQVNYSTFDIISSIVGAIFSILALVALTNARYWVRMHWSIPSDCCCDDRSCFGDCCCVFWCGCCSVIQMMRHTHDENVDSYDCCSNTGLGAGPAEVV
mmetsp:Transcript_34469/g.83403  ORF Transcript_34469/g.83403 Transcript_34469/m.83403 type:complete len:311 (+) Transcript_34469:118-1050(+)|eukprot:CAMPEP_0181126484 /NCGR_PEP_ID=MMETSP1071-20121207/27660_1 /TAXON_ID=35127 /ORGANISM="Thalassiosira sp., Strain NH16" /LENGTH=310 /DNA_ID=CAMNT_0023212101 /DNA_START=114 /DNA_END=1046 /DNA_ORIENTATION=-